MGAASAESDKVSLAGMVDVLSFTDTANSLIETGALINQDEAWRTYASNPHENNLDPEEVDDPTADEQVVSVEASNYMELINMAGYFALECRTEGVLQPHRYAAASKGGKGGVGGALFVMLIDNTTHSTVEDGAADLQRHGRHLQHEGRRGDLQHRSWPVGRDAGTVSVGGTVMYTEEVSDTIAQLGAGAEVTGREVSLYAANLGTNVMFAGGVSKGSALGAGISVAVNNFDRTTLALIGDQTNQTLDVKDEVPGIDVAEDVTARAIVGGDLYSFTVAGAVVSEKKDEPTSNPPGSSGRLRWRQQPKPKQPKPKQPNRRK